MASGLDVRPGSSQAVKLDGLWVAQMIFHALSAAVGPQRETVRILRLCLVWRRRVRWLLLFVRRFCGQVGCRSFANDVAVSWSGSPARRRRRIWLARATETPSFSAASGSLS